MTNPTNQPALRRELGLIQATALAITDMVGIGPYITIPLLLATMGGPQAMIGWFVGALLAFCDGLVWAELGAALPKAGGSYNYLRAAYGPATVGRWLSFLMVWQIMFSAPLSVASGSIGFADYMHYLLPGLSEWGVRALAALFP
ncbi:MAG: APC family permease, partial [Terriglobia bacterium]